MAEELGERTESPSGRKLGEARNKGRVAKSADLSAAIDLIGALILLAVLGSGLVTGLTSMVASLLDGRTFGAPGSTESVAGMLAWTGEKTLRVAGPFLLLMFGIVVLAQFLQVGWLYTLEPIKPNVARLNPIDGFKRLAGRRNLVKTGTSLLKLVVVGSVAVSVIMSSGPKIAALPAMGVVAAFLMTGKIVAVASCHTADDRSSGFHLPEVAAHARPSNDQAGGQGRTPQHGGRHGREGPPAADRASDGDAAHPPGGADGGRDRHQSDALCRRDQVRRGHDGIAQGRGEGRGLYGVPHTRGRGGIGRADC
jgi:hypothetical protein